MIVKMSEKSYTMCAAAAGLDSHDAIADESEEQTKSAKMTVVSVQKGP